MSMMMQLIDGTTLITYNYKKEWMALENCWTLVNKELSVE